MSNKQIFSHFIWCPYLIPRRYDQANSRPFGDRMIPADSFLKAQVRQQRS